MALSYDDIVAKAADQTLTVREAIEYAMAKPNVSENHFKQLRALRNTWEKTGLPADITLAEMRKQENWSRLGKDVNKSANKFGNFQALELNIRPILEESGVLNLTVPGPGGKGEIRVYPLITGGKGSGSLSGGAQRTGLAGERPMRSLIPQDDIEKIYSEAIPEIRAKQGDVAADVALYHKATFQRPEQILGDSAIKKADVVVSKDYVTVKGVTKGKKTRPTVKYPVGSPMADLITRNLESSKSEKLFDITPKVYDDAYRASISPRLVAGFEDALPLIDANDPSKGVVSTPSATRSFMVKIVTDELGYPDDVAQAMMGHTDSSILSRNYRGLKPLEGMGQIVDNLLVGVRDKFGGFGEDAANFTSTLTEEERRELAAAQVAEAKAKTEGYLSDALEKQKKRVEYYQSEEGQKFMEGQQALAKKEIEQKLELQAFEAEMKAQMKAEKEPEPKQPKVYEPETTAKAKEITEFLKGFGKFALAGLGITGIATASKEAYAKEMGESGSTLLALGAGAATGAYEALEPMPLAFMRPQEAGRGSDIVPTDERGRPQYKFVEAQEEQMKQLMKAGLSQRGAPARPMDKQMSDLQGIRPDIEITYPNEEK